MRQPWSPFGISVDEEGRVLHDLEVTVQGLPAVEGESYHVWLTEPTLERVVHLGAIESDGTVSGRTDWHQLMVVVSRESSEHAAVVEGDRWTGPIVLRGFSAGARVQPLGSHSIFQPTPM